MSGTRKKLRRAAIGFALGTLSLCFNAAAQERPDQPVTPDAPNPVTMTVDSGSSNDNTLQAAPLTRQQILDQALVRAVEELADVAKNGASLTEINNRIDSIVTIINGGGNMNQQAGALPNTVMTFMQLIAYEMERPEIVERMIRQGADIQQQDARGLRPIDYALLTVNNSQRVNRGRIESAVDILKILENAGAKLSDTRLMQFRSVTGHADLAQNIVGMDVLRDRGLVTQAEYDEALNGPQHLADMARNLSVLSADWLRANGATLVEFPDAAPGGPEPYKVKAGETLQDLARRFVNAIGAPDEAEALRRLATQNGIALDANGQPERDVATDEIILIPLPPAHSLGFTRLSPNMDIEELARRLRTIYYDRNATPEDIIQELMRMNGMTRDEINNVGSDRAMMITFTNDSYTHMQPLTPPPWANQQGAKTTLIIIEETSNHAKQTYRVAMGTNYGINPNVDLSQFLNWNGMLIGYPDRTDKHAPSDAQNIIMNLENNPLRDRIIFSHSMVQALSRINHQTFRNDKEADMINIEALRLRLQRLENSRPIIFTAAGNEHPRSAHDVQSFLLVHSPRTLLVGAVGRYNVSRLGSGADVIAPYSSLGGEICAPLPTEFGRQMEGTSFSTPLLAGAYRQFVEWYGHELTHEEIMAVGMMTASRDMLDLDPINGYYVNTLQGQGAVPAPFRTNGGGLGYNERCGPGNADFEKWNDMLLRMVEMKRAMQGSPDLESHFINAGPPATVETNAQGETTYVYRIAVPTDMTLGRLTFVVPQEKGAHSEVSVRTPAGFEIQLNHTLYDTLSTHAFAYEDVRAGEFIEIRTTAPLGEHAGMMLRGHADGNVIQTMRDELQRQGVMPQPLRTYRGTDEVPAYPPPSRPIIINPANDDEPAGNDDMPRPEGPTTSNHRPTLPRPQP